MSTNNLLSQPNTSKITDSYSYFPITKIYVEIKIQTLADGFEHNIPTLENYVISTQ